MRKKTAHAASAGGRGARSSGAIAATLALVEVVRVERVVERGEASHRDRAFSRLNGLALPRGADDARFQAAAPQVAGQRLGMAVRREHARGAGVAPSSRAAPASRRDPTGRSRGRSRAAGGRRGRASAPRRTRPRARRAGASSGVPRAESGASTSSPANAAAAARRSSVTFDHRRPAAWRRRHRDRPRSFRSIMPCT